MPESVLVLQPDAEPEPESEPELEHEPPGEPGIELEPVSPRRGWYATDEFVEQEDDSCGVAAGFVEDIV
jgi:hypothetical protein